MITRLAGAADDIRQNFFSPQQFADVVDKYKSGPIVDAFRLLISPSNDARVQNGAQKIYIYKSNLSTKASGILPTAYGTVYSANYGFSENTVNFQVTDAQSEVKPILPAITWITEKVSGSMGIRVNGLACLPAVITLTAPVLPDAAQAAIENLTGVHATGGVNRGMIATARVVAGDKVAITFGADGLTATLAITLSGGGASAWSVMPTIGDSLYIPSGSVIANTATNVGGYLITGVTASTVSAVKMADPGTSGVTVSATLSAITDAQAFSPIVISNDATTASGVGATLEMYDNGGALPLEDMIYGGSDLSLLTATQVAAGDISLAASGANVVITISTAFNAQPAAGDIINIRGGSVLVGAANANVGNYLVTAATASTISATKFSGTPASVGSVDIVSTDDLRGFAGMMSTSAVSVINTSSAEREVTINVNRQSDGVSEDSLPIGGNIVLKVGYFGATCTMTISHVSGYLTTVKGGGSGSNLSVKLSNYDTIQQLVDYINAQTGYTAAVGSNVYASLSPALYLDSVSAVGICSQFAGEMPGLIKSDSKDIQGFFDASSLVTLTRILYAGLPAAMSSALFLANAVKGGTTAASVQAGIDELQKVRINTLVSLFSRNATDDIVDELTEPSSTYQIDAINAAVKTHVAFMSDTQHRSERNAFVSYKGSFVDSKTKANTLAAYRLSLAIQDVKVQKIDGTLDWVQPWGLAAVAAGMQAGADVGEPMTKKYVNVSGVRHQDFDPSTQYNDAIANGILFLEMPDSGFRFAVGNTTYGADASFVYNRISVIYSADVVAYNLRQQLESAFVGVSIATASAGSIRNKAAAILDSFKAAGYIIGDDTNNGNGFKNLSVSITGNVATLSVIITPAQGVDFILNNIVLDTIHQTA